LYKIVPGVAQGSYGIYVAKLAGLPQLVIDQATQFLLDINETTQTTKILKPNPQETILKKTLDSISVDQLSPKDALNLLYHLKDLCKEKQKSTEQ